MAWSGTAMCCTMPAGRRAFLSCSVRSAGHGRSCGSSPCPAGRIFRNGTSLSPCEARGSLRMSRRPLSRCSRIPGTPITKRRRTCRCCSAASAPCCRNVKRNDNKWPVRGFAPAIVIFGLFLVCLLGVLDDLQLQIIYFRIFHRGIRKRDITHIFTCHHSSEYANRIL